MARRDPRPDLGVAIHTYPDRHHFASRTIEFKDDFALTLDGDKLTKWLARRAKTFKKYGLAGLSFVEGDPQLHIMRHDSAVASSRPMWPLPPPGVMEQGFVRIKRGWSFAHELGHVLGLQHRFVDVFSCMSYSQWPWPDLHDIESVAEVYGGVS